uniref:Putative secreted protein n=1 Tax=Rhipicephalus microplus TaxID=6941 RepID=A0A6M2DCY9_RHIMP
MSLFLVLMLQRTLLWRSQASSTAEFTLFSMSNFFCLSRLSTSAMVQHFRVLALFRGDLCITSRCRLHNGVRSSASFGVDCKGCQAISRSVAFSSTRMLVVHE